MILVRLVRTVLAALLLAVPAFLASGCSAEGPASPDELFEHTMTALREGRHNDVFDLYTMAYQKEWAAAQEAKRVTLVRNPGARARFLADYHATWEEYVRMTPREMWRAHHVPAEPLGEGSKIVEKSTDPVSGRDVLLTWETKYGQRFRWETTWEAGRGWRIRSSVPVKLEGAR